MTAEEIKEVLEKHKHWLNEDCDGWEMMKADLTNADLRGADLSDANMYEADLTDAKFDEDPVPLACPEEGSFIGWKAARKILEDGNVDCTIVKLKITEDAKRSSATSRKRRCSKAEVLEIKSLRDGTDYTECVSNNDSSFVYKVGEMVSVPDFDEDRWNECSAGIHFFITRQEAVDYI